jgi:CheY-like chemotaxis protein
VVELHGGRIEAHSAGGGLGSEFVVRLSAPSPAASVSPQSAPPCGKAAGLRVLVVDDNEDAAMLLAELLRMAGHVVAVAHDGAAALKTSASFIPEVALLDIGLPGMDGYELAQRLRAAQPLPRLRLIALTGYGEEKDRLRTKAAGFDVHLVKPVDFNQVTALLAPPGREVPPGQAIQKPAA